MLYVRRLWISSANEPQVREDYSPDGDAWSRTYTFLNSYRPTPTNTSYQTFLMTMLDRELSVGEKTALPVFPILTAGRTLASASGTKKSLSNFDWESHQLEN